jgi:regulator of protease activity HflC (stomatin/prohibitin superfamily)
MLAGEHKVETGEYPDLHREDARLEIVGGILVLIVMLIFSGIKVVKDSNRLVIYRFGKVVATKGAGVHLVMPIFETAETVDTRVKVVETPEISATTLELETVMVSAICMFQVGDVAKAVTKVDDYVGATGAVVQTALRTAVSQNDLQTLQTEQKGINKRLKALAEKQTREWGVNIKSVEIKHLQVMQKLSG